MAQYEQAANTVAAGDGTATATFAAPGPPAQSLQIDTVVVLVTGSATIPVCAIYDGFVPAPGRIRASSLLGDRNTFRGDGDTLYAGQAITVQWTGCTPGASCNAIIRGVTG